MKTLYKNQVSKKAITVNCPVFIFLQFINDGQEVRKLFFSAELKHLKIVREFCKKKDDKFKDEVHSLLVDNAGYYTILFTQLPEDPSMLLNKKVSKMYLEYCHMIQHYVGCFSRVSEFLEKPGVEYFTLTISIDVCAPEQTTIAGRYHINGCEEENIDYQLN